MDDQDLMRTYGNAEPCEGTTDRPLVTFALFAYNQEKFIREAVNSAFEQTYEPLEIILSDDCSSDGTYQIMKEMANSYKGPHTITLRKTEKNNGVCSHVLGVVKESNGSIIVMAAGDDISKIHRTSYLTKLWQETGAWGLFSRFDQINENGILEKACAQAESLLSEECTLRKYFFKEDGVVNILHGATSAYDIRVFENLDAIQCSEILNEDGLLTLVLNLHGRKIHFLEDSLVKYRSHQESLTNGGSVQRKLSFRQIRKDELKANMYTASSKNLANFILWYRKSRPQDSLRRLNERELNREIKKLTDKLSWFDKTIVDRIRCMRSVDNAIEFGWALPRLFGKRIFFLTKFLVKNAEFLFSTLPLIGRNWRAAR